jgi:hypothetical protein
MEKVNRTTRNGAAFTVSNLDLAAGRGGASEEIIGLLGLYPRLATASITRYYLGHVELGAMPVAFLLPPSPIAIKPKTLS